jgi:uncharacterized protein
MEILTNKKINGKHGRPILLDAFYNKTGEQKAVVIYCHGFKSFKDWGTFNLIAKLFAEQNYVFVKFNFSHNGTTAENPEECPDPEAFAKNNFSIEMDDLGQVIDWVENTHEIPAEEMDTSKIYLLGHSRGGGIAILKAAEDPRIRKVVTWASVNDFSKNWNAERLDIWKEKGYQEMENKRTGQVLKMYYQLVEDYFIHKRRLDISEAVKHLKIPLMVIHGTEDEGVPLEQALEMKRLNPDIQLELIPGAGHTFGARHPYSEKILPQDMQIAVERTIEFLEK